jgi:MoxR-like ATPase
MTTHPNINVSHVPEILRLCGKLQITPFFLSNPGIGKTQQVEAYAKAQRAELMVLVASLLDRTDFQFPLLDKEQGTVRFVPLEELKHLSVEHNPDGGPVILYWNELNASPETLYPVLYRLINERKLGKLTLRANVMQLADGNPTVASSVVNDLPGPAKRRFQWFVLRVDFDE